MPNNISKAALVICYLVMTYTAFFFYPKWEQSGTEATISWDASGYYMYLPAMFIYEDLKHCSFKDSILAKYKPTPDFQQAFVHQASGNYVMKYSSGQALTMLPFFGLGHIWAKCSSSYPADGFSFPYQFSIGLGMFLYAIIGLFFLRKILLKFFKDSTVAILLMAYVLGSNYLNYSSIDQAMTHNTLFTIYTLIIYLTIRFYSRPDYFISACIWMLCGLAALIRPTDIISVLIPLLWNISNLSDFKAKLIFYRQHLAKFILFFLLVGVIGSIQFFYWKYVSGDWVVYSYQDQGFTWLPPHIYDYTLSYRCGWLRYCPMMVFSLIGLVIYAKEGVHKLAVIMFTLLNLYIVSAWDVWDYGGTAGRAMVQSYPLLAFPFALLLEKVNQRKWLIYIFYPVFILFIYLNIWWLYNAHKGSVQVSEITRQYYWKVVGRWSVSESDRKLLDNAYSYDGNPVLFTSFYKNNFDTDSSINAIKEGENAAIRINRDLQYSTMYKIERLAAIKKWVRVSADFHCVNKEWDVWKMAQFIVKFYNGVQEVQSNSIRIHRYLGDGESKRIFIDAIVPKAEWDSLSIELWNSNGEKELYMDNLEAITFDE